MKAVNVAAAVILHLVDMCWVDFIRTSSSTEKYARNYDSFAEETLIIMKWHNLNMLSRSQLE